MSDPAPSHSSPLDSLAPGVVLQGRYSLKDRVPRWIAERRFKARDLETGEIVAILVWPDSVPWREALTQKAVTLSARPFREMGRMPGLYWIVTDWVFGMRDLTGEAETAEAVWEQLGKSQPVFRGGLPPRRSGMEKVSSESRSRPLPETPVTEPPTSRAATWWDAAGLGVGLGVALLVGGFTWQMTQSLREPWVIEKKTEVSFLQPAQPPEEWGPQLADAQRLRKDGSTTAALVSLLDLDARTPGDPGVQNELNSLLRSLEGDLDNLRAGLRPPLVRAIQRAAESGNAEALRLSAAITATPPNPDVSPEPLPIR